MNWGEMELADGSRARVLLSGSGSLDLSEPWSTVRLSGGQELQVPTESIAHRGERLFFLDISLQELGLELDATPDTTVIPVIEEELEVTRGRRPSARVEVEMGWETQKAKVEEMLSKEVCDVERVTVDREIPAPIGPRQEGDVTIIPVVEVVLVVTKRYILREEIHVKRRTEQVLFRQEVELRRQTASVRRQELTE